MTDQIAKSFKFDLKTKKLQVLDQLKLPETIEYVEVSDSYAGSKVIKEMKVRGAPLIAAVGCLSLVAELNQPMYLGANLSQDKLLEVIQNKAEYLVESRPTAVNLRKSLSALMEYATTIRELQVPEIILKLTNFCNDAIEVGHKQNKHLGLFGAELLSAGSKGKISVLTHCNTGSLATVGYGTALGVIRSLHELNRLERAYCTETRPYNQGSRLTAWELVTDKIPATLIADNMVAYLMSSHKIDAVVVGADCVARNGDTANKIGTLQVAILAKHYGVPFYIAAPTQSIDLATEDQSRIKIEQRPADELRRLAGVLLAPEEVEVWNPCFDVTPAELITEIITEIGTATPKNLAEFISGNRHKGDDSVRGLF